VLAVRLVEYSLEGEYTRSSRTILIIGWVQKAEWSVITCVIARMSNPAVLPGLFGVSIIWPW